MLVHDNNYYDHDLGSSWMGAMCYAVPMCLACGCFPPTRPGLVSSISPPGSRCDKSGPPELELHDLEPDNPSITRGTA